MAQVKTEWGIRGEGEREREWQINGVSTGASVGN